LNSPSLPPPQGEVSARQRILDEKRAREARYKADEEEMERRFKAYEELLGDASAASTPKANIQSSNGGITITFGV